MSPRANRTAGSVRKRIEFHAESWHALHQLSLDSMKSLQDLADEAFRDLLKKHRRPTTLKEMLRESACSHPANDRYPVKNTYPLKELTKPEGFSTNARRVGSRVVAEPKNPTQQKLRDWPMFQVSPGKRKHQRPVSDGRPLPKISDLLMSHLQGTPSEKLAWLQTEKAAGNLDGDDPDEIAEAEALLQRNVRWQVPVRPPTGGRSVGYWSPSTATTVASVS